MQSHILQIPDDIFYGMSSLFTVGGKQSKDESMVDIGCFCQPKWFMRRAYVLDTNNK